jgi:hypothetical protein
VFCLPPPRCHPPPCTVIDRSAQLKSWVDYLQPIARRGVTIFAYTNHHYAGFSPDTLKLFREYWRLF